MKPPSLRLFAAGVTFAAALLCCYLLTMQAETRTLSAGKTPPPAVRASHSLVPAPPAQPWESLNVPKFEGGSPGARKWLNDRARDAAGLIAMWQMSGDEALLLEAAKNFPDDPVVCRAMIHHQRNDSQSALPWIERLITAEPKSPEGLYQKTRALLMNSDQAGALAVLRQAVAMGCISNTPRLEGYNTLVEAALAGGSSSRDAALLAVRATQEHSLTETSLSGAAAVVRFELADAKAAGSEERLLKIAGLGFAAADNLSTEHGLSLQEELAVTSLEMDISAELTGDTAIGTGSRTVDAQKSDTEYRRKYLTDTLLEARAAGDFLLSASDEVVTTYAGCFIGHGEQAATDYALSQFPRNPGEGTPAP